MAESQNRGTQKVKQTGSREKYCIAYLQPHRWSPAKFLFDQCVVRVAATDTLRTRNVMDGKVFILKTEYYFSHFIHAHHFIAANIDWLSEV